MSEAEKSGISRKQETFIAAMLSLPTITAAARAAGVTDRTARLWMKQPLIQEAYRAARKEVFDEVLEGLRDCAKEAIDTLRTNLTALEPAVQVRAAHIILTQSIQVHKIEQLEARIQELEDALKVSRV
jgi:DNA-binding transcriptional MerR regulator